MKNFDIQTFKRNKYENEKFATKVLSEAFYI